MKVLKFLVSAIVAMIAGLTAMYAYFTISMNLFIKDLCRNTKGGKYYE